MIKKFYQTKELIFLFIFLIIENLIILDIQEWREGFLGGVSFAYVIAQNNNFVQKGIGVKYRIPGSGIPFKSWYYLLTSS